MCCIAVLCLQRMTSSTVAPNFDTHTTDLPAPGTNDVYRVCTPFPFEANLTATAAQRDMELHIDNFEAFVYFSPGARRACPGHALKGAAYTLRSSTQVCAVKWQHCEPAPAVAP